MAHPNPSYKRLPTVMPLMAQVSREANLARELVPRKAPEQVPRKASGINATYGCPYRTVPLKASGPTAPKGTGQCPARRPEGVRFA